jgi:hypothetical protein
MPSWLYAWLSSMGLMTRSVSNSHTCLLDCLQRIHTLATSFTIATKGLMFYRQLWTRGILLALILGRLFYDLSDWFPTAFDGLLPARKTHCCGFFPQNWACLSQDIRPKHITIFPGWFSS